MITHDVEQGSPAWIGLRLGLPTASCFDRIITPTGKPSTQADAYANTLIAEWLTGIPGGVEANGWMQRGTDMEPEACAWYEMDRGVEVSTVGLITDDDMRWGCSPDRLVGSSGLLEVKVPAPHTHVGYLLGGSLPGKYKPQVQGQLWIAEREWCDFLSYHEAMPPLLVRVERDDTYIKAMEDELARFVESLERKKQTLLARGIAA